MPPTIMPASNTLLAWDNYVLTASLSATSQELPITNLQLERGSPSTGWQTAAGVTQGISFFVQPALQRQTWRAFGVFRSNLTPFAQVTITLWNNISPNVQGQVYRASVEGPEPGFYQSILIAPTDIVADFAQFDIDDPGNTDGFINVPLAYAGPAWQLAGGVTYETTFGYDDRTDELVTVGGQEFFVHRWDRRRAELAFTTIRGGEAAVQLAELQGTARRGNNILFCPDITSDTLKSEAIYGRLQATSDVGFSFETADRRSWRARMTERL